MASNRARLRDLGIHIGRFAPGRFNAITDVPGVLVGQKTVIRDTPHVARSGVTVIQSRGGAVHTDYPMAGFYTLNGIGEMTGLHLIEEWGVLSSPIVITNTNQVGMAWDTISRYGAEKFGGMAYKLPVIAETYDGWLNDIDAFPLKPEDVLEALESAASGPVAEGNVGGGTGMIAYDFKGGIGTASRIVPVEGKEYILGVIIQANHGDRHMLRVNGAPVGLTLDCDRIPDPWQTNSSQTQERESSSIIVVIATDAPLLPDQCKRLARRATIGLARTGGAGFNASGDIFLAFSTGNHYDPHLREPIGLTMLPHGAMNPMIEATAEAVEEAILNALTAAETMVGYQGHVAYAVPLDELVKIASRQ